MSKQKIQIAVAIDENGNWATCGFGERRMPRMSVGEAFALARCCLDDDAFTETHIIEAELPIPKPKTVQGTVRKAKDG